MSKQAKSTIGYLSNSWLSCLYVPCKLNDDEMMSEDNHKITSKRVKNINGHRDISASM